MASASRRGYISFLLMVPLAWLVLAPLFTPSLQPSTSYSSTAILRADAEQVALKRALMVSARDSVVGVITTPSIDEASYVARVSPHSLGDCAPKSFEQQKLDELATTGVADPNPTRPINLLYTNERGCLIRARVLDTWSSLLSNWNGYSDFQTQLSCAPSPATPTLANPLPLDECASNLRWSGLTPADEHLTILSGWSVQLTSLQNLSAASPLPQTEVYP